MSFYNSPELRTMQAAIEREAKLLAELQADFAASSAARRKKELTEELNTVLSKHVRPEVLPEVKALLSRSDGPRVRYDEGDEGVTFVDRWGGESSLKDGIRDWLRGEGRAFKATTAATTVPAPKVDSDDPKARLKLAITELVGVNAAPKDPGAQLRESVGGLLATQEIVVDPQKQALDYLGVPQVRIVGSAPDVGQTNLRAAIGKMFGR